MNEILLKIKKDTQIITKEILEISNLEAGDVLVIGCSSSEVAGKQIGTYSNVEVAKTVFDSIYEIANERGIFVAAQCCEHLNRAIIIEKELAKREHLQVVNVVPQPKAGGSFATAAYNRFECPVAVEWIKADAGIDIGDTLIGMHLKAVAVPVRLSVNTIGEAHVVCARTRAKFIGGERAVYDEKLL